MAYVVEDGTGLSTATGMVTEAVATEYLRTKYGGRGVWFKPESTKDVREGWLLNAAEVLLHSNYSGERVLSTQAMPFPRTRCQVAGALPGSYHLPDEVPVHMQYGTADLAYWLAENPYRFETTGDDETAQRRNQLPESTRRLVDPFIAGAPIVGWL